MNRDNHAYKKRFMGFTPALTLIFSVGYDILLYSEKEKAIV